LLAPFGIIIFASFVPGDALAYWNDLALAVNKNLILIVSVDGGPGQLGPNYPEASVTIQPETRLNGSGV